MKKRCTAKRILAGIMCLTLMFTVISAQGTMQATAADIELPDEVDEVLDRIVNYLIDAVHRVLLVVRYPWEPKSGNTLDLSRFSITFEDNFDGDHLSSKRWMRYSQGVRKGGYWDEKQSSVADGFLTITTEYLEDGKYGPGYYTDRVATREKFQQKYGYFECRAKLPAAQGMWAAFWVTARIKDGMTAQQGTEIDVFESPLFYRGLKGKENNLVSSNLHYGGYKLNHKYRNVAITKVDDPYNQFHTYGVEWTPDGEYIFYIDGIETGRSNFGGGSEIEQYMILSCEVDGAHGKPSHGWSGIITDNTPDLLPAKYVVDYVRAYQYNDILSE